MADRTYQPHEFAKRAGVTIRALHHYDRLGLLKPGGRTAAGYRLCTDRDLVRLEQIVALKFIGFPLSQIRELLSRKDLDVAAALRQQRQIIAEKRDHLDRAIRAIERAEQLVSSGGMKKYYTEEQLNDLRKRYTPEVQAKAEHGWADLVRDVEAAIARGDSPDSETGRKLAERKRNLIGLFTGGDPGITANLQKLYEDQANWPANFKKPYSDAVDKFLCEAAKALVAV